MIQLTSKWFCAGLELDEHGRVKRCAPILAYMKEWPRERVLHYARTRKWIAHQLGDDLIWKPA